MNHIYPTGATVRYGIDSLNRIAAITNKASSGGGSYVTKYAYDAVGNVTNVLDHWCGNTLLEYDRVNRRTKRTLPNSVVTEWPYNWRDQVTNISHKIGSSTLASVGYERAAGGEPTKIIREDGTYVLLSYDSALRLTNEVYFSSGGSAVATNSYGYDASGTRTRLVTGAVTYTIAVVNGYQVTQVKQGGTTVETYGYDSGGRITSIIRSGVTNTLAYNTSDQVTNVTIGTTNNTYVYDAAGRRVKATQNGGSERRFLVASTPGSDLESPQLIADSGNALKHGYVFVGDDPLLRFDSTNGNGRVYYLEDGMGSVIGLTPQTSPTTNNTTRLFYDGFGRTRATNGPAPTIPTGTGGDFRFQGMWLEDGTGLYHARAREYDPKIGRFVSRDPVEGEFKEPETLAPYVFANNNPYVYSDPSGGFTLIEISISDAIGFFNDVKSAGSAALARKLIIKRIGKTIVNQLTSYIQSVLPLDNIVEALGADPRKYGTEFQGLVEGFVCDNIPMMKDWLWLEPRVRGMQGPGYKPGDVYSNGIGCAVRKTAKRSGGNIPRPDFIISPGTPLLENGSTRTGFLVGEVKWSGMAFKNAYLGAKPRQAGQWAAITGYAKNHSYSHSALFISLYRIYAPDRAQIIKNGAKAGVLIIPVSVLSTVKK